MLVNLLRLHELRLPEQPQEFMHDFRHAGVILFKLGCEEIADDIMQKCIDLFKSFSNPKAKDAAKEQFVVYCLECNTPRKAEQAAAELLQTYPQSAPCLTVQMLIAARTGQLGQAKELAEKVQGLARSRNSIPYKMALRILAIDSHGVPDDNAQHQQK